MSWRHCLTCEVVPRKCFKVQVTWRVASVRGLSNALLVPNDDLWWTLSGHDQARFRDTSYQSEKVGWIAMSLHDSPSVLSARTSGIFSHVSRSVKFHAYDRVISGLVEPLQQVRLLSALRSGRWSHGMGKLLAADKTPFRRPRSYPSFPHRDQQGKTEFNRRRIEHRRCGLAPRHSLCLRCVVCTRSGSNLMNSFVAETIQLLLSHRAISPNGTHPPGSGTTALHLAASLGRAEIVSLLLDQPGIDDTLRDSQGRTCKDVAKGKEAIQVLQGRLACSIVLVSSLIPSRLAIFPKCIIQIIAALIRTLPFQCPAKPSPRIVVGITACQGSRSLISRRHDRELVVTRGSTSERFAVNRACCACRSRCIRARSKRKDGVRRIRQR